MDKKDSIIKHREDYRSITLKGDYVAICNGNSCNAFLLAIIEERMQSSENGFAPLTYEDFKNAMHGTYGRSWIIKGLKTLEDEGLIIIAQQTEPSHCIYKYQLVTECIQRLINKLPQKREKRRKVKSAPSHIIPVAALQMQFQMLEKFNGQCAYCQRNTSTTWDHVIADANGGETILENFVPACSSCNSSKADRDALEWMASKNLTPSKQLLEVIERAEMAFNAR